MGRDDEKDDYWEQQAELPLRERDGLWWTEVAFPTVVVSVFAVGIIVTLVIALVP